MSSGKVVGSVYDNRPLVNSNNKKGITEKMKLLNKIRPILFCAVLEMLLIGAVSAANINPTPILYFLFYNLLYGVV